MSVQFCNVIPSTFKYLQALLKPRLFRTIPRGSGNRGQPAFQADQCGRALAPTCLHRAAVTVSVAIRIAQDFTSQMSMSRVATIGQQPPPSIIGSSPALQRVLAAAAQLATSFVRVLITGETGVGKDLVARSIHCQSTRAHRRFVALNCAGLSETL